MQTVFKERRVDELRRLVLHQLELTNSIEHYFPVKTINAETCVMAQLVAIHYFFARGLQEKADEPNFLMGAVTKSMPPE
jgi:hypothetical protein